MTTLWLLILGILGLAVYGFIKLITPNTSAYQRAQEENVYGFPTRAVATLRNRLMGLYAEQRLSLEVMNQIFLWIGAAPHVPQTTLKPAQAPTPEPKPPQVSPVQTPPLTTSKATSFVASDAMQQTGFFGANNIKTMLLSGSALFVLGAYLFVRSYWAAIPGALKFSALLLVSSAVYGFGCRLWTKKQAPKTAESLLGVGLLLIPFNAFSANVLLLNHSFTVAQSWLTGCLLMGAASVWTVLFAPTFGLAAVAALAWMGSVFCFGWAQDVTRQSHIVLLAAGASLLAGVRFLPNKKEDFKNGFLLTAHLFAACTVLACAANGFFLSSGSLPMMVFFLVLGAFYAVEARASNTLWAYAAGMCWMAAGVMILRHLAIPPHRYGLFFVPAAMAMSLRAWTLEKKGRVELAAPYFHLGQLAIMASMFSTLLVFQQATYIGTSVGILLLSLAAYIGMGALYRHAVYTYAVGFISLWLVGMILWNMRVPFSLSVFWIALWSVLLAVFGIFAGAQQDEQIGAPLRIVGYGALTAAIFFMGGKVLTMFFQSGAALVQVPSEQLSSGMWVGALGTAAYLLLARVKRQVEFVYPALASMTLVYVFGLQKMQMPIDLPHLACVVVASLTAYYVLRLMQREKLAACFALWAQIIFIGVSMVAFVSPSTPHFHAVLLCLVAFLPLAIVGGTSSLFTCALGAVYLAHYVWFRQEYTDLRWALVAAHYALQLVVVNCGIVFLRTLLTFWSPATPIMPFRLFAAGFSILSLALSTSDAATAWLVFLAYGLLALFVSLVLYQGRFVGVGTTLLLLAYEFFIASRHVELTEAYTVPVGLFLLAWGYVMRQDRGTRDTCYAAAQFVIYVPSLIESLRETWAFHGLFVGVASLTLMLFGISQRNRCLTMGSFVVLLGNGVMQSRQFFAAIPRWVYLGTGGTLLLVIGGLFEFHREWILKTQRRSAEALDHWD